MVLNDIIEQAAGHHSRASDHGGMQFSSSVFSLLIDFGFQKLKLMNAFVVCIYFYFNVI